MEFRERIKDLRESKNWTQGVLAEKLNVSRPTIAEYEKGKKFPGREKLNLLADIFNVSTDYLLGRTNEMLPVDRINSEDLLQLLKTGKYTLYDKEIKKDDIKLLTKLIDVLFEKYKQK